MGRYTVNLVGKANDRYSDLIIFRNMLVRKQYKKAAAFRKNTLRRLLK